MQRYLLVLFMLLISSLSIAQAREVTLPKSLIIELVNYHCSSPQPDIKVSTDLEYDCSDAYEDANGEEQSMDYSLRLLPIIKDDFNQDGIQDIALEIESMGPLGGSVYTNSAVHYLLLDKDKKVINEHEILLYAPFSEHIVEYDVKGKQIYYSAIPNYRSNPDAYENGSPIDPPFNFTVSWETGEPISSYYLDSCTLAKDFDKQILKPKHGVKRSKQIDIHDYTQVVEEKMEINNLSVAAELNGCNAHNVSFYIKPQEGK